MNILESLIHFQNKAEKDFNTQKSFGNGVSYILAMIVFLSSTLIASLTWPLRSILKLFNHKKTNEIHQIDSKNIESVLKTKDSILMNFSAEWCGPCLLMNGILKDFILEKNDIYVAKINADSNSDILKKYGIRGIPQFLLIIKGEEIKRHAGPMSLTELKRFCLE